MILIFFLLFGLLSSMFIPSTASPSDWTIDGDTVYIDDENAYLSATPHTIVEDTWVTFQVRSKDYEGDIDACWLFDTTNCKPTKPVYYKVGDGDWTELTKEFTVETIDFENMNKAYLLKNINIQNNTDYYLKCFVDIKSNTFGKYWWGVKPSALGWNKGYYIDPWWGNYVDFTTFTEVDPDNRWTNTSTRCTVTTADRDETDYDYYDYGGGYFGSTWEHNFTIRITSTDDGGLVYLYAQSNELDEWGGLTNGIGVYFAIEGGGSQLAISLRDRTGASDTYYNTGHDGTKIYYMNLNRTDTTLILQIYNDSARTDLDDTLTITMVDLSYRYLYAGTTVDTGDSGYSISGYIEYLGLKYITPILSNEVPENESTNISVTPALNITVDDSDDDMLNATWYSNSSGSWVQFATNNSIDTSSGAVNIVQTNSNFSEFSTTYWWSINVTDDTYWANATYHFTTEAIVLINASTGIEETNATLNGYISSNASGSYSYGFWVGTSTPVTEVNADHNITGIGTVTATGSRSFSHNDANLTQGTHYYVVVWVSNATYFISSSNEDDFWTKCDAPSGFTATLSGCNVALAWTRGAGAVNTVVIRTVNAYATWPSGGTEIYNSTGSSYSDTTAAGSTQYYRVWSWTEDKLSDGNASATLSVPPCPPTSVTGDILANTSLNISWTTGTGANTTMVRKKVDSFPSSVTDGTQMCNSTVTYVVETDITQGWYIRLWSYANGTYSSSVDSDFGALVINTYSEESNASLYFDVLVRNESGTQSYESRNNTNPLIINVGDNLPLGDDIRIIVSPAENYSDKSESFTYQFTENGTITYVVLMDVPESKALTNVTCRNTTGSTNSYPAFTLVDDVITILADAADEFNQIIVNYTHYEYDDRVYYRDLVGNHVYILDAFLPDADETELYVLRVVDSSNTPIEDADMEIKRSVNGTYEIISSPKTDADGKVSVYLTPNEDHLVIISKDGFETKNASFIPDPDYYGSYYPIIFRLTLASPDVVYIPSDVISINGEINNNILYINISDSLNLTDDIQIYVYELNHTTGTETEIYNFSCTDESTVSETVSDLNISNSHRVTIHINHSMFAHLKYELFFPGEYVTLTTQTEFDDTFTAILKYNPFGWSNFILFIFVVISFFSVDRKEIGPRLMLIGAAFLLINYLIGFNTLFVTYAGGIIPPLIIFAGFLIMWDDSRKNPVGG